MMRAKVKNVPWEKMTWGKYVSPRMDIGHGEGGVKELMGLG